MVLGIGWHALAIEQQGATQREAGPSDGISEKEECGLHIVNPGRSELREYFDRMRLAPRVRGCEEWSGEDLRGGMLVAVPGASRLLVGKPKRGGGVDAMERNYEVTSAAIGGSPKGGNVAIRLTAGEIEKERSCLENVAGVRIQWVGPGGDSGDAGLEGDVIVKDVRFLEQHV